MYKLWEFMFEFIGWLLILASPFFAGLIIGAIIYFPNPDETKLIISILVASLGLIIGIIWATRIWRRTGTIRFLSRIMETPDLDKMKWKENQDSDANTD